MDDSGNLIGLLLIRAAVVAILFVYIVIAVIALTLIGGATALIGVGWGGGTAFWNYGKSIKKNLIDSIFSS